MLSAGTVLFAALQSRHAANKGGPPSPLIQLRYSAVVCWMESGPRDDKNIRAAVRQFKADNPGRCPKNPSQFIRTWVGRFETYGTVESPRSPGRPVKLTPAAVDKAVQLLWAGYEAEGRLRFYTSIQQAVRNNSGLKAICVKFDVTPATLLKHMSARWPDVVRRRLVIKRQLSEANKLERRTDCSQLLQWEPSKLQRVFWIDAATIYVVPKWLLAYAPPDGPLVVSDARLPSHSSQLKKLKFYVCINAILGAVALVFVTGTTELESEEEWLVGGSCLPCLHRCCVCLTFRVWRQSPCCWQDMRLNSTQSCCLAAAAHAAWLPAHGWPNWLHPCSLA